MKPKTYISCRQMTCIYVHHSLADSLFENMVTSLHSQIVLPRCRNSLEPKCLSHNFFASSPNFNAVQNLWILFIDLFSVMIFIYIYIIYITYALSITSEKKY